MNTVKRGRRPLPPGERRTERVEILLSPSERVEIVRAAGIGTEIAPYIRASALRRARGER